MFFFQLTQHHSESEHEMVDVLCEAAQKHSETGEDRTQAASFSDADFVRQNAGYGRQSECETKQDTVYTSCPEKKKERN